VADLEKVLRLFLEQYFDLNVQHFHEKLRDQHGLEYSYTWVKTALQEAGLVERRKKPGSHRKRRSRRRLPETMLHIDGSEHRWFKDDRYYELLVIMDDATSEIYYAQLMEAECTRSVMAALREVVETQGVFCSLYSDRAGHFFVTAETWRAHRSEPSHAGQTRIAGRWDSVSSPGVHQRVQRSIVATGVAEGHRVREAPSQRPGLDLQRATRAHREQRQHDRVRTTGSCN
jgi:hypothetical protein